MNWDEITLLYKSIVVLPQDKNVETPITSESTPSTPEPALVVKDESNTSMVEEDKAEYEKIRHPFVIFTKSYLKLQYQEDNSSFKKIISALDIRKASKYINAVPNAYKNVLDFDCVWCIGLDIAIEKELRSSNHSNIHFSPDILSLNNNEEKKAMFLPLKEFITSNAAHLKKL